MFRPRGLLALALALTLAVMAAVGAQAVGPVLSGQVSGSVVVAVEQGVLLDLDYALGANPIASPTDSATARNDEGTEFTVAMTATPGESETVTIYLQNDVGAAAAAILELNVPKGIDVEVGTTAGVGTDAVAAGQLSRNSWLLTLGSTCGNGAALGADGIVLTISPKDNLAPGFYTISGRIVQS